MSLLIIVLTGTVTNAATNRTLEGARVVLQGTNRVVLTAEHGAFQFANVAPGQVIIEVTYTSLDTTSMTVGVTEGTSTRQDFALRSHVYTRGEFRVADKCEGNSQALTLRKPSWGTKNVVSADLFGNLVGNPADLLVRLPGVEGVPVTLAVSTKT